MLSSYFLLLSLHMKSLDYTLLPNPCYVVYEEQLRRNLSRIKQVAEAAEVEFILAFKAFALWRTFPIFRDYITHTTASSPYEAQLAYYEFGSRAHTYSPAYEEDTFDVILNCSSHISFNSLSQYGYFSARLDSHNIAHPENQISAGLRINPERSSIKTELYDPAAPGSRFGVLAETLPERLPEGITGFHCHNHCESSSFDLEDTLGYIEDKFGAWLPQISWLNLGGGHLLTREGYDVEHLIATLRAFKLRYPHLHLILEPGSAFAWRTGELVSRVVDIVENKGIKTAILNVSFTCHMPDCLEMPYWPAVIGAQTIESEAINGRECSPKVYRLGGNSCLSGDYMGYWEFAHPLRVGELVVFEDMIHYTTVKTTMFNGIHHPSIALVRSNGELELLREYRYEDYRDRMC